MPAPRRILGWSPAGWVSRCCWSLFWQAVLLTQVVWWSRFDPGRRFMRIRLDGLKTDPQAELRQQWVPYERISIHLKRAVVAAEDDRFLDHAGFDWEGISALWAQRRGGGASPPAARRSASSSPRTSSCLPRARGCARAGGGDHPDDQGDLGQAPHPRGVSERGRMGRRRVRRGGCRAPLHSRSASTLRTGRGRTIWR